MANPITNKIHLIHRINQVFTPLLTYAALLDNQTIRPAPPRKKENEISNLSATVSPEV